MDMPEGPEVETVRQGLLTILQKKINKVEVSSHKKYIVNKKEFSRLSGARVTEIKRVGKLLIWEFSRDNLKWYATNAFGMTGLWRIISAKHSTNWDGKFAKKMLETKFKHFKVALIFDQFVAIFVDARTFGNFNFYSRISDVSSLRYVETIGPDILASNFNYSDFITRVRGKGKAVRKQAIGKLLLNPAIIAGCGNIYKSEALYLANIHPEASAYLLSDEELRRLGDSLVKVAKMALEHGGATLKDFENVEGYNGLMQNKFQIFRRAGLPCKKCATKIKFVIQSGRKSFYCSKCQLLPSVKEY